MRRIAGSLVASYVILVGGVGFCGMLAMGASAESSSHLWYLFPVLGLVGWLPLRYLGSTRQGILTNTPREGFWSGLWRHLHPPEEKTQRHKVWKRKKSTRTPQTRGQEYLTFVRSRRGPEHASEP